MKESDKVIYKKHQSFVDLRHPQNNTNAVVLDRISKIRTQRDIIEKLSLPHREILKKAFVDLFEPENADKDVRYTLAPNVVEEIATLPDESLPRYLVHRYRYEIFPQKRIRDSYPPYLQIEPTSVCNYRCVFCFQSNPEFTLKANGFMGHMTLDMFKNVVDQAEGNIEFISLASRGEPLSCKDIIPMLDYTRDKFLNLKLNTNASMLDEARCHSILSSGIKTVVFSADAAEELLYSKLRVNGKLDVVLKNIERFQKIRQTQYKNKPIITRVSGVKFSDDQDIESMEKLWSGLVEQVTFVRYCPWENVYIQPENDIKDPCSELWLRMYVWWDGKANPCEVDYKSMLFLGSIKDRTLSELWCSPFYEELRKDHMNNNRLKRKPCSACKVG